MFNYQSQIKPVLDRLVALVMLLVCLPIIMFSCVLIFLEDWGPVFFVQTRVGQNLCEFKLFKLRSMSVQNRVVGIKPIIGRAEGVTRVGFYLRRLKADELPQFLNILMGNMSIIGPRPGVPIQLKEMSAEFKLRYSIRPGLTGLAQVSGNIHLSKEERYQLDLEYLENITFYNDLLILIRTVALVILGEKFFVGKRLKLNR